MKFDRSSKTIILKSQQIGKTAEARGAIVQAMEPHTRQSGEGEQGEAEDRGGAQEVPGNGGLPQANVNVYCGWYIMEAGLFNGEFIAVADDYASTLRVKQVYPEGVTVYEPAEIEFLWDKHKDNQEYLIKMHGVKKQFKGTILGDYFDKDNQAR